MQIRLKSLWNYADRGLIAILGTLLIFTIASIIYLTNSLRQIDTLLTNAGGAVGTVIILQDLLVNVQQAESAARGYIITGNETFLPPYQSAVEHVPADLKLIKANRAMTLSDKEIQQIGSMTDQKMAGMARAVSVRQSDGYEAAQALVQTSRGNILMQNLRDTINGIVKRKLDYFGPRERRAHTNLKWAQGVASAMAVFVVATCVALIRYFRRAILRERALENTKSEFLSLASHQLRTPATNVKQYIGMMLDGYIGDISDEQRHALTIAYNNNESEINIMNDLLDVAKLDLNRIQLRPVATNIVALAKQVIKDYKKTAAERMQLLELGGDHEVMAKVDGEYMKGVLENLIDNAVKYSKPKTSIKVRLVRQDDTAVITITDHGLGIKKRDVPKLFKKFSRLDNEFSTSTQGSGLGLYWVKQIVELHGGTIDVTSRYKRGSVFTIRLPIR